MPEHIDTARPWSEGRLPLAGAYPCLTFQLNATYHSLSDSLKWVLAIREPNEKVELSRWYGPMMPFADGIPMMHVDIEHAVQALGALRRTEVNRPN